LIKRFLECGADLKAGNGAGETVLDVARKWKCPSEAAIFSDAQRETIEEWEKRVYKENLEPLLLQPKKEINKAPKLEAPQ